MRLLDTSVILRYLTGEPPALARRAEAIIDRLPVAITDVVIAESAYVLASVYGVPRAEIVDTLIDLLRKSNIEVWNIDKGIVTQALLLCRASNRVSFADAMLWAVARAHGADAVYSFDERFPANGLTVLDSA